MNFDQLFKLLNLPPILMASLSVSSILILSEIDTHTGIMNLSEIRSDYEEYLSFAAVITTTYMIIFFIVKMHPAMRSIIGDFNKKRIEERRIKSYIKDLSEQEIQVLSLFIYGDCENIAMNTSQPPVNSLLRKDLIYIKTHIGGVGSFISYISVRNVATKHLKGNKTLFPDRPPEEIEAVINSVKKINSSRNEIHN